MARPPRETDTEITGETGNPTPEPAAKPQAPSDVLTFVDRGGAIAAMWNSVPEGVAHERVKIPQQLRHRMEPGLSFCPGPLWAHVSQTPSYTQGVEAGRIRAVAGHRGTLAEGVARVKPEAWKAMLAKTFGVEVLLRIQALEQDGSARKPVLDALEERLDKLRVKVAEFNRKRGEKRRRNR